ncbi:sugar ABC transporter ATP-binding protein [Spirochaetia bacterium]|nr:sugar ABC transporter ATP-binding protein [Spirochaetia bacterium]
MKKYWQNKYIIPVILYIILIVVSFIMILPFLWTLSSSFKFDQEIFEFPIRWIPKVFRSVNYEEVWTKLTFVTYYLNTFKVTIIVTIGQILFCSLAAYAFAKLEFPGRNLIFMLYIGSMMIPWHAIMIPQFIIVNSLGLFNTHWAVIVLQLFSAFGIFLLRQNMLSIPNSLCEAARIDGYSEIRIFANIIMPLCKAALATLAIFAFNFMWNDYLGPTIYLNSPHLKTLQLALAMFRLQYGMQYGLIMAGTVSALAPMVIVYVIAQKYLIEGVASAGLKG